MNVILSILAGAMVLCITVIIWQQHNVGKPARMWVNGQRVTVLIVALDTKTAPQTYIVRYPDGHEGHAGIHELTIP